MELPEPYHLARSNNRAIVSVSQAESIHILQILREARAAVSRDAEAFHPSTLVLEKIAHIAGANVGSNLGQCRPHIVGLFDNGDTCLKRECSELFDTGLQARNMAVHGGAWVRHHSSRLVDLFILVEDLMIREMRVVEQVMVRSPLEARFEPILPTLSLELDQFDLNIVGFKSASAQGQSVRWETYADEAPKRVGAVTLGGIKQLDRRNLEGESELDR